MKDVAVKKTPDRKVAQGFTVGTIIATITAVFTTVFHKSMPVEAIAALPAGLGLLGHFFGSYLAPYEPRIQEIIAYAKALIADIPSANLPPEV
jgi:hypothetical protein